MFKSLYYYIVVVYTALCIYVVSGYSNPNYPHIGRQCPCFCSIRSGDSSSPYWDNQFGGEIDEATCNTTTCLDANQYADYMPFCREVVTYKFCPRQFDNRYLDLQGVELISSLDTHARTCHTESMAIGARTNDTLFPMWVKKRKDFQRVFNRFNEREIPINMRVVVPIRKHPEERSDDSRKSRLLFVRIDSKFFMLSLYV